MTDERVAAFRDALREGDTAAAIQQFDGYDAALSSMSDRESALRNAARGVIARVPKNRPAHSAAQSYLEAVFAARRLRTESKNDFLLHLEDGPQAQEVAEKVGEVAQANGDVQDAEATFRSRAENAPVGALVRLYELDNVTVPKGGRIEETARVENVGFSSADGVDIEIEGYTLSATPSTIQTLEAGAQEEVTLTGEASTATNTVVTVTAGDQSSQFRLQVLGKTDYLQQALDVIAQLTSRLDRIEDGQEGNARGRGKSGIIGLRDKLTTAEERIDEITDDIESNARANVDNRIESVANLMNAFINQAEGYGKQNLSDQNQAILIEDADQTISVLERAVEAEQ